MLSYLLARRRQSALAQRRLPVDTTPDPDELRNIFSIQVENDVFNRIGQSDRDYTNGVRLGWLSPALPQLPDGAERARHPSDLLRRGPGVVGHAPFRHLDRPEPLHAAGHRARRCLSSTTAPTLLGSIPSFALQSIVQARSTPRRTKNEPVRPRHLAARLRPCRPGGGGEFVQNNFHRLIGDTHRRMGWANQLHNEPTLWPHLRAPLAHRPTDRRSRSPKLELRHRAAHGVPLWQCRRPTPATGGDAAHRQGPAQRLRPAARAAGACRGRKASSGSGFGWYFFVGSERRSGRPQHLPRRQYRGRRQRARHASPVRRRGLRPASPSSSAACASATRRCCARPEFFERDRFDQFGSINVTFRY